MLWIGLALLLIGLAAYDFGYRRGGNASYDELDEYLKDMHLLLSEISGLELRQGGSEMS